jgi:hypothetical protein
MSKITKYTWICDGCDEQSSETDAGSPVGWVSLSLGRTYSNFAWKEFIVCNTCNLFLFNNERKGHSWLQRLKHCLKLGG